MRSKKGRYIEGLGYQKNNMGYSKMPQTSCWLVKKCNHIGYSSTI